MIYFLQNQKPPYLIKIGWTQEDNISLRIQNLKNENKAELTLLTTLSGERREELKLHLKFSNERMWGEWFFPSKNLIDFLLKHIKKDRIKLIKENDKYLEIDLEGMIINNIYQEVKKLRYENSSYELEIRDLLDKNRNLKEKLEILKLNEHLQPAQT